MVKENETVRAPCNQCLSKTKHTVLFTDKQTSTDDEQEETGCWWEEEYTLLKCCGCDNITLRRTVVEASNHQPEIHYYPPSISRPTPKWLIFLIGRRDLYLQFQEIYSALQSGSNRLALMGTRAVIELVLNDKVGDNGNFTDKLKKMEAAGFISSSSRTVLEAAVEAGHAVMHRSFSPKAAELSQVMDIVEHFVQAAYLLESSAGALAQKVPKKQNKKQDGVEEVEKF